MSRTSRSRASGSLQVCTAPLAGIYFNNADGTVTNVTVLDITQNSGCTVGDGIRVQATGTERTVNITD